MDRLQKVIAAAGITSRRKAEDLITAGRVKVNGNIITELGYKVSENDIILVDDNQILKEDLIYIALNKPTGYITSTKDEKNRKTVLDLLEPDDRKYRLYPIGRLDYDSSGIILLTNDGELCNMLLNPNFDVEKEYLVRVDGLVEQATINKVEKGVIINGDYKTKPARCNIVSKDKKNCSTLINIVITEGKKHQVRLMFDSVGHKVKKLHRVRFAMITTEGIGKGFYRYLKIHEIKKLKKM